jgi:electron transfer flavoprotein alpha subunit
MSPGTNTRANDGLTATGQTTRLGVVVPVKQVPLTDSAERLGHDGRLVRDPEAAELNPWCRRAITVGLRLARELGVPCTAVSVGPPSAERALREARAAGVDATIHVCDSALAGSDALATAHVLAALIRARGGADAVVAGLESIDGATGVVPAMLAELLGLTHLGPFLELDALSHETPAHWLRGRVQDGCGSTPAAVRLPAVVTVAERSAAPAKVPWERARSAQAPERLTLADLPGLVGPIGQDSLTAVSHVVAHPSTRAGRVLPVGEPALRALRNLLVAGAHSSTSAGGTTLQRAAPVGPPAAGRRSATPGDDRAVLVLARTVDDGTHRLVAAARRPTTGPVTLGTTARTAGGAAVDDVVRLDGQSPMPVAAAVGDLVGTRAAAGVLAAADLWERQVLGRVAVRLGAGLLTDLTDLTPPSSPTDPGTTGSTPPESPVGWLGAKTVGAGYTATLTSRSQVQLVTLRTGFLPPAPPSDRSDGDIPTLVVAIADEPGLRGEVPSIGGVDAALAGAEIVVGIGRGVAPDDVPLAERLARHLGAELAGTRPVTDAGLLAHARQVGVTGTSIAPRVYLGLGMSGAPRHLHGLRGAGTIVGVTLDPVATITHEADLTAIGDWRDVASALLEPARDDPRPASPVP